MTRKKRSGIYKITNTVNDKFYIGRSSDLVERKCRHFCHLRKGTHHNKHLQRAFNKYGQDSFIFEVLEYTENIVEKEQEYFDKLNCGNHKICYNLRDIADKVQQDDTRYRCPVSQFDLHGNYINSYNSIKQAAVEANINNSSMIIRVLNGKRKSSGGFLWQRGLDTIFNGTLPQIQNILKHPCLCSRKPKKEKFIVIRKSEKVNIFDLFGRLVYASMTKKDTAVIVGYKKPVEKKHIQSTSNHVHGYFIRPDYYTEDLMRNNIHLLNKINKNIKYTNIIQKTLDGEYINIFSSIKEIQNFFGNPDMRHLYDVLNGNRKSAYGYKWEQSTKTEDINFE